MGWPLRWTYQPIRFAQALQHVLADDPFENVRELFGRTTRRLRRFCPASWATESLSRQTATLHPYSLRWREIIPLLAATIRQSPVVSKCPKTLPTLGRE